MNELNDFWGNNVDNSGENGVLIAEQAADERCGICGKYLVIRTYYTPRDGRTYLLVECKEGHIRYRPPKNRWF